MRRISLVFAIAALLIGVPVQAQKQMRPIIQPPPSVPSILIQGENGEGYMTFDMKTGDFMCNLCEYGYIFKGKGEVKIDGCNIYFSAITDDYTMFASVNKCDNQAKCVVEVFRVPENNYDIEPITEYLVDKEMLNSKPDCNPVVPAPSK